MMNLSNTERLISNSLHAAPSNPSDRSNGLAKFGSFVTSPALHVPLLVALVLVTFGRTITSYLRRFWAYRIHLRNVQRALEYVLG